MNLRILHLLAEAIVSVSASSSDSSALRSPTKRKWETRGRAQRRLCVCGHGWRERNGGGGGDSESEWWGERAELSSPLSSLQFSCHWGFCFSLLGLSHKERIPPPLLVFIYSISRHAGQNGPFLVSKMALDSFAARRILTESHERAFSMMLALFWSEYSSGTGISGSVSFGCCSRCGKETGLHSHLTCTQEWKSGNSGPLVCSTFCSKHLCLECSALPNSLNYFISGWKTRRGDPEGKGWKCMTLKSIQNFIQSLYDSSSTCF